MIHTDWMKQFACPVCLERAGCEKCGVKTGGHDVCRASYSARVSCACGGPNKRALEHRGEGFYCSCCLNRYPFGPSRDYVDLLPRTDMGRVSRREDEERQEQSRFQSGQAVRSTRMKARVASRLLGLKRGDFILDLGSGTGRLAAELASAGGAVCGIGGAPFFLRSAVETVSLVTGDLTRLPLRKGVSSRACAIDLLQHLNETGIREVLIEARRVVSVDGRILVYTQLRETERKDEHTSAIRSHQHFDEIADSAGLKVQERVYDHARSRAAVEALALKMIGRRNRTTEAGEPPRQAAPGKVPTGHIVDEPLPSASSLFVARGLTHVLMLESALFGKARAGAFFGVLTPRPSL